ncbi:phosphocarrier protein HPr [Achromatium sp. WMS3]|nr:phosphocarrier protein HPr [Achromatium sp. WMS3]
MIRKDLTIINKLGLHARAAAKFIGTASSFSSDIKVEHVGKKVNGKSIFGIMMLGASKGTTISLTIDGEDEIQAIEALETLIANRFGEGE